MIHATAQLIGGRSHQCDATATYTDAATGARAYALLDGIGSSEAVQKWTRSAARRLARAAAVRGDAEAGLRAVHAVAAAERRRDDVSPSAVAVVAVAVPGGQLQIAWCGDARAYVLSGGQLWPLTKDHNLRQHLLDCGVDDVPPFARNRVTSYLGDLSETPVIAAVTCAQRGRLLLASDGAYEPLKDFGRDLAAYLAGSPVRAARALVKAAVEHAPGYADNATALVADFR